MGGKWKKWTEKEDSVILESYNENSAEELAKLFLVDKKKLRRRAIDLGVISVRRDGDLCSIDCKYCNKVFKVKYAFRQREYCSKACQSKAIERTDIRKSSKCVVCEKAFKHYGERILCSKKCTAKYLSEKRVGENNPAFKEDKWLHCECKNCGENFSYTKSGIHKDRLPKFCNKGCWNAYQKGKNKRDGGLVSQPYYPPEFKQKKLLIKERDDYKCQLCSTKEKEKSLHIHHIDYDKMNNEEENLVCLCQRCHMMTNFNRTFWENVFSALYSGSKIVKKGWGIEVHIVNNPSYCLKYLIFFEDRKFSFHYHSHKKELWHCLVGEFECILQKGNNEKSIFPFKKGDKIELEPGIKHQLFAKKNSIITEVSTTDYVEDSYRIIKGD